MQLPLKTPIRFTLLLLVLLSFITGKTQVPELPSINISQLKYNTDIWASSALTYLEESNENKNLSELAFTSTAAKKRKVFPQDVSKKPVLFFKLANTSDSSVSVYFFPGRYFPSVSIYKLNAAGVAEKLPDITPETSNSVNYRKITVAAHDSGSYYAVITSLKTYTSSLRPAIVNAVYVSSFIVGEQNYRSSERLFSLIICGLLIMMIVFSVINYFQGANKEFLHYAFYTAFLCLMLLMKALIGYYSNNLNFFIEAYFDFILFCAGHLFYLSFIQRFLDTKNNHRFIHKLCNIGITALLAASATYTFLHYTSNSYVLEFYIENVIKILLLVLAAFFVFYARKNWENKIFRYLAWGNGSLFVLAALSYLFTFIGTNIPGLPRVFTNSLVYYELGILLELFFFLAGLSYKNKMQIIEQTRERERLRAENQMKEYEKELAVLKAQQEERNRISVDMHDELGSGMTAIRLMSELAKAKMKENSPAEIDRISDSANDVLNKMNAIIWSMNSGNDTLGNLVSYIRSYAMEYFENTPINCRVTIPEHIEEKELTGDKRRNIFLCVKETLNNALKHSAASEIVISIETNRQLKITISDNGKGIDLQRLRQFGNGLKNIQNRMTTIGGAFSIENNNGTVTTLVLPL
jgi:signal transduction histidine kinase